MSRTIIVIVAPGGATTVETAGFAGRECKDATRELEAALGRVVSDEAKAEMYRQNNAGNRVSNRN